jgi:hypothetical protein
VKDGSHTHFSTSRVVNYAQRSIAINYLGQDKPCSGWRFGTNAFDTLNYSKAPGLRPIQRQQIVTPLRPAHYLEINAALAQPPEQTAQNGLRSSPRPGLCGVSCVDKDCSYFSRTDSPMSILQPHSQVKLTACD